MNHASPSVPRAAGVVALLAAVLYGACVGETSQLPKPRAYPRIEFPEGESTSFALEVCPFDFQRPAYALVERDTTYFDEAPKHPCWFDLVTPQLNGRVHFSYYPIASAAEFEELRDDAFDLAGKHTIVANYIDEQPIARPDAGVYGFAFDIEGDVASPFQFYVTDSARHFLRGAVYVNAQARADSLAPVYAFLREDALEAVGTLAWEGKD